MTQPNGWVTYTLSVLALIGAAAGYFMGSIDGTTALQTIFAALAVFGVRKSIANQGRVGGSHF